jgi:hypothetical protein
MTVLGLVSVAATRRIHLVFADDSDATASLRRADPSPPHTGGLANLRYAVLAVPGAHCIERMVSRDAVGRTLWEGAPEGHSCPSG